ncbi:phosphate regulon sensor histidine kinase PhoR [Uliginosibacterium gangwonense]|uniref:phosphate regulon sensor histidine kinase PhoR n=1 Tax=Uliginosibacterium gangwonense TaxID=392736 RepID=UPI0003754EE3|nr:phosphate regulon sensor histidine kinase PhoR [Uliginosibacterium gangwonense]
MGLTLAIGGAGWFFFGPLAAVSMMLLFVLALSTHHLRNIGKLLDWAAEPIGTPVPRALGVWDYAFASINRRARIAYDQRERLVQALSRFREASQAMPDGVVYLSDHFTIEWCNHTAERFLGIDAERDTGHAITNLVRQPDFVNYLRQGAFEDPLLLRSLRQEGLVLTIQVIPFGNDQQMILARDITQLERLETMRRDFVANVSHELKTPLTVVSGFIETLIDGGDDYPLEQRERFLNMAMEQSLRMQRLIDDLLTLSSLQAASVVVNEEEVDVQAMIAGVGREAEALSGGRHQIEVLPGPAAKLLGCSKELHSAFANLASNAVRYTPEGGSIRLIWQLAADGSGCFSVEDTGIGIEPQHLPRLTERFYRVDRGRSRETGGTGLGLAIVKHILTRHQGVLEIASEPGKGSRFTAHLPARRVFLPAQS